MENFRYQNTTEVVFGKGQTALLPQLLKEYAPANPKILLTYGGGSIKSNGAYDQVKSALAGFDLLEFGGIEPNPQYSTLMKAVEIVKAEGVNFLLAVGGGSTLDGTKFIAAASKLDCADPWDAILEKQTPVTDAVPLADVITLPATGSETNGFAVISKKEETKKLAFWSKAVFPKFSIIDPSFTFTLPPRQTANGIADTFVHVVEQYVTHPQDCPLQDRQAEAILLALVEAAPRVLANPNDYQARANIFWMATQALNGWLNVGTVQCWAIHAIGHELTAQVGVDHGRSLALVLPGMWRQQRQEKGEKIAQLGRRVFGIAGDNLDEVIDATIARTIAFFESLGIHATRREYGVTDAVIGAVAEMIASRGVKIGDRGNIGKQEIIEILNLCD
ncbi:MAG: iron-containing alcohol dehydrogenase [Thermoguttaceae bacterium]|nr:iron-containing alcohol dehydrogenase [Thermoguttaceae bacterium]MBR2586179.1 iron-containing alcohol dehydrogenase [Thermoguttaceae bacterium]MBR3219569.1 iron-containing alcohol dehydrogenase [Thermoguttaceae bacterium]